VSRSGVQDPTIGARIVERPEWWATRDSNPDGLPHTPLKRARLPVPPAALAALGDSTGAGRRRLPPAIWPCWLQLKGLRICCRGRGRITRAPAVQVDIP